jgi:uroporphyrinogen-III decarboxylase
LRHLLPDPTPQQVSAFRQRAAYLRQQAQRLGVVLDGGWLALGDAAMWLCGMERILYGQMDDPQFLDELLETIFIWEMHRLDLLLEEGIDVLVQMAWYENTDFWTPSNYRRLLRPRIEKFIAKAHAHGVKFRYIMTRSWKPYCKDFLEMGVDCLTGVDPVQDRLDLAEVKRLIGGQICLMGGVNSAIMLSQWTPTDIYNAVDMAMRSLSPGGGFVLYPVDAVFNNQPWENVTALIEAWSRSR